MHWSPKWRLWPQRTTLHLQPVAVFMAHFLPQKPNRLQTARRKIYHVCQVIYTLYIHYIYIIYIYTSSNLWFQTLKAPQQAASCPHPSASYLCTEENDVFLVQIGRGFFMTRWDYSNHPLMLRCGNTWGQKPAGCGFRPFQKQNQSTCIISYFFKVLHEKLIVQ